ncbi:hypothetical protein EP56_15140 [Listeriaceae bacterium FSL A5-0209]|nr:hypothetical protein EP56_15140 [Listeriaceae bacterium FSL A5-0209]
MTSKFNAALSSFTANRIGSVDMELSDALEFRTAEETANKALQELTMTLSADQMELLENYIDITTGMPAVYARKVYELAFYDGISFAREMEAFGNGSN